MRDFFRGWKRKFGMLTLVTALMFTGLWVRSLFSEVTWLIGEKIEYRAVLKTNGIWIGKSRTIEASGTTMIQRLWWVVVPYWQVITPLTLVSAFLLLTNPRKSTPGKIIEPRPEVVA